MLSVLPVPKDPNAWFKPASANYFSFLPRTDVRFVNGWTSFLLKNPANIKYLSNTHRTCPRGAAQSPGVLQHDPTQGWFPPPTSSQAPHDPSGLTGTRWKITYVLHRKILLKSISRDVVTLFILTLPSSTIQDSSKTAGTKLAVQRHTPHLSSTGQGASPNVAVQGPGIGNHLQVHSSSPILSSFLLYNHFILCLTMVPV